MRNYKPSPYLKTVSNQLQPKGFATDAHAPNAKEGEFMPKEKRALISKEIRGAHFTFGFDCKYIQEKIAQYKI